MDGGAGKVFVHRQDIAFGDVDYARILYYPRWLHYCHRAMEAMCFEAFGRPYVEILEGVNVGFPTVALEADYRRPLPYGNVLEIRITMRRLGRTSMDWRYRGFLPGEDEARVEARNTTVCVTMDGFEPVPIPPAIREGLSVYLEED